MAEAPTMIRVLYTLDPTIVSIPSVLSVFGFARARIELKSSGQEVPAAMSVAPGRRGRYGGAGRG